MVVRGIATANIYSPIPMMVRGMTTANIYSPIPIVVRGMTTANIYRLTPHGGKWHDNSQYIPHYP